MVKVRKDLIGMKFGRLTVIEQAEDYVKPDKEHIAQWKCKCDCGNECIIRGLFLKNGHTKSCGCLKGEKSAEILKNLTIPNTYDDSGDYVIGYTAHNEEFWFDKQFLDDVKKYQWHYDNHGYVATCLKGHSLLLHRYIMSLTTEIPNGIRIDHIIHPQGDENKIDNRLSNLRLATPSENNRNKTISKRNTSGVVGVHYYKNRNNYQAFIRVNDKNIFLGYFNTIEEATAARKEAEAKYFGEFVYKEQEVNTNES